MNASANYNTVGNVTITDNREKKPAESAKPEKKTRTEEQKKAWEAASDKIHKRMYPNAKEEKPAAKEAAKPAAKEEVAKADSKPKTEDAAPAKDAAKELADSGEGKQTDAKPKAETPPPEPKVTAKKEDAAPPVDIEKLAKSVAKETAEAMTKKTEAKPDDDVPEARRRDLEAVDYLDTNNPRYKGAGAKYRKFAKDEAVHIAKWEAAHPGETFDPEADEHAGWYDKHEPELDARDLMTAEVEIASERKAQAIAAKETAKTQKEIESIRTERQVERAEAVVPQLSQRGFGIVASTLGESVVKALTELKEGETLEAKDPAAHVVLAKTIPELNAQTLEAARIFGTEGKVFNSKNAVHNVIAETAQEFENEILADPIEKSTINGRKYAPYVKWLAMGADERANHWTMDANLLSSRLAQKASQKASELYKSEREKAEIIARAYGYTKNSEAQQEQVTNTEKAQETPAEREKPRSPSTSTATVIQPGTKVSPKTSKDGGDSLLDKMFRR